ncbi:MAG: hypothetical protein ACXWE9_04655 [Methylobacter sp.]
MSNQNQNSNETGQSPSDNPVENAVGSLKALLIAIGGVALVLSILVLLPMFLTYLSEGDYRAPSEIHPTDTGKTYKSGG